MSLSRTGQAPFGASGSPLGPARRLAYVPSGTAARRDGWSSAAPLPRVSGITPII